MSSDSENFKRNSSIHNVYSASEGDEPPPIPGYKEVRVFCDESGIHGAPYVGFGSLWVTNQRRGDFQAMIAALRQKHGFDRELKWSRISAGNEAFAKDVITEVFKRPWIMFHCLIVRVGYIDMAHHASKDEAFRKYPTLLLSTKMKALAERQKKAFRVIVDPLPSSYAKADEAAGIIIGNVLRRDAGERAVIQSLTTRDSKDTAGIQVADLLLGGTMAAWQKEVTAGPKLRVSKFIASHLGWQDMGADTHPSEWKFNVWNFYDPTTGEPREVKTRKVNLLYPVVPFRRWQR